MTSFFQYMAAPLAFAIDFIGQASGESGEPHTVWQSLEQFWRAIIAHLPYLGVGVLVLVVTALVAWVAVRGARKILAPAALRDSLKDLCVKMVQVAVWIVGLLAAAMVVFPTLTPGRLLATLGLGSIAIGFAFKDIFENFFAGILILWRFPFEKNDFIICQGIEGKVEDITIRNTMIRKSTGELVIVPNSILFKNPVDVLTNLRYRRVTIVSGIEIPFPYRTLVFKKPLETIAKNK